jgi:hypothetical protein
MLLMDLCSYSVLKPQQQFANPIYTGLSTLRYFIFMLTRGPEDTHIVSKISFFKMCIIYARIYENIPSEKVPTLAFI